PSDSPVIREAQRVSFSSVMHDHDLVCPNPHHCVPSTSCPMRVVTRLSGRQTLPDSPPVYRTPDQTPSLSSELREMRSRQGLSPSGRSSNVAWVRCAVGSAVCLTPAGTGCSRGTRLFCRRTHAGSHTRACHCFINLHRQPSSARIIVSV